MKHECDLLLLWFSHGREPPVLSQIMDQIMSRIMIMIVLRIMT